MMRIQQPTSAMPTLLRRGISLLEVLMSIFIITIGVLGVAAMLPLATHLANRGATADRASIAGKEADRQFRVRSMHDVSNWLPADGIDPYIVNNADPPFILDPIHDYSLEIAPAYPDNSPLWPFGSRAYCLDPRGCAHGITGEFPIGGADTMKRITLRPAANKHLLPFSDEQKKILADEFCRLQDDLNFKLPDDDIQPPINNLIQHDPDSTVTGDEIPLKRFSDGDFSWLATLVRENDGYMYTLSVVVLHKRVEPRAADENLMSVTFLGDGYGGGDVTLTGAAAELAVPGQWIMLADSNAGAGQRFRWYRIIYASELSGNAREVTLAGRDWDITAPYNDPQATLVSGVIGVYERTIRLEGTFIP